MSDEKFVILCENMVRTAGYRPALSQLSVRNTASVLPSPLSPLASPLWPHSASDTFPRNRFTPARTRFPSTLLRLDAAVGLVAIRDLGRCEAARTSSPRRANASRRLAS